MEVLIIKRPDERPRMLGTTAEKNPRKLVSELVGSPSLIRFFGRNVCFAQTPGVREPGRTLVVAGGHS